MITLEELHVSQAVITVQQETCFLLVLAGAQTKHRPVEIFASIKKSIVKSTLPKLQHMLENGQRSLPRNSIGVFHFKLLETIQN